jgi:mRNA interferase HicA
MTKRGPCLPAPFSGRGMTGAEFLRALRKLGRRRRVEVRFVTRRGKGSHGTLYWGDRKTIVKDRKKELSRGLLADMLRQLGLDPRDLDR